MLKTALKWGGYSGGILIIIIALGEVIMGGSNPDNYAASQIFGYVTFVACLGMIYLGLNEAGDSYNTIWKKVVLGLSISFVAGILFGVYNVIYTSYINPEFLDEYYAYYISQLPVQSGPEYDAQVATLEADKEMFMHPLTQFLAMSATVIAVGIPESILLAVIHKKLRKA